MCIIFIYYKNICLTYINMCNIYISYNICQDSVIYLKIKCLTHTIFGDSSIMIDVTGLPLNFTKCNLHERIHA